MILIIDILNNVILQNNIKCNSTSELKKIEQNFITENNIKSLYNSINSSCDINEYNYYNYSSIYKIINKIDDKILYIGSTSVDIKERINFILSYIFLFDFSQLICRITFNFIL